LALVSIPGFDPGAFVNGIIAGVYPPGSTFKPTVALAALTAGVLTPETTITCFGQLQLGNAVFHCWRHGGHGPPRLHDAIKKSCDVFFYETARRLGIERLTAMAPSWLRCPAGGRYSGRARGAHADPGVEAREQRNGVAGRRNCDRGRGTRLCPRDSVADSNNGCTARLRPGGPPAFSAQAGVMIADNAWAAGDFPLLDLDPEALAVGRVVNEPGGTAYAARISEPGLAMGGKSGTSQVRRISEHQRDHGLPKID
jgi:penicillin-binding protein 2